MDGYQRMAELLAPSHSSPSLVPSLSTYNKENKKWAPTLAIIGDKHSTKITIIIIIPTKLLDRKKIYSRKKIDLLQTRSYQVLLKSVQESTIVHIGLNKLVNTNY